MAWQAAPPSAAVRGRSPPQSPAGMAGFLQEGDRGRKGTAAGAPALWLPGPRVCPGKHRPGMGYQCLTTHCPHPSFVHLFTPISTCPFIQWSFVLFLSPRPLLVQSPESGAEDTPRAGPCRPHPTTDWEREAHKALNPGEPREGQGMVPLLPLWGSPPIPRPTETHRGPQ